MDVSSKLFSLPKRLGKARALAVSRLMHIGAVACLIAVGMVYGLHIIYFAGVAIVAALIIYEQSLVRPNDYAKA